MIELLREADVLALCKISKASLWKFIRLGKFPPPRRLGDKIVVWPSHELKAYLDNLPLFGMERNESAQLRAKASVRARRARADAAASAATHDADADLAYSFRKAE